MRRGRKHIPPALRKQGAAEPAPANPAPRCPAHLSDVARQEWRRLCRPLCALGVVSTADRAALAAYCQAYGRWVEAERKLKETPMLLKTPSGYVQQSPWLSIANRQMELMGRFMSELGLTPSARTRIRGTAEPEATDPVIVVRTTFYDVPPERTGTGSEGQERETRKDRVIALNKDVSRL